MLHKIVSLTLLLSTFTTAQNLQLHYEASGDREYLVSTLEMFKPDQYGSTFWFVDMEYNTPGVNNGNLAYWEIARSFTLPVNNLSATIQYNDGVASDFPIDQVWLAGINYYLDLGFVALPIDILYRAAQGADSPDFQLTTTWFVPLMDGNIEFSGFFDLWSQDKFGSDETQIVILGEPQIWYNANEHLSIGTEVEISNNFVVDGMGNLKEGVQALPTLGLRWTF
ncbi:MAG: DUF5020 family protein [FCB group bacterium]|nr:DUF5020 family protein [FCB group bacterium]MBL7029282.1 DUF5020 family protein [Candidatus Neomarinimicrobiota bacterium]MBL7121833.1 DUF5020 family protein [Candidatus Neomarinimicrobiota bacterium]